MKHKNSIVKMTISAMCMALCYVLPFFTGGIPQIGNALCPMHIPVLLCGLICGPWYAMAAGAVSPLLRWLTLGTPPLFPVAVAMCFELTAYGFFSGFLYRKLPKRVVYIYVSLLSAMLLGRGVWGVAQTVLLGIQGTSFGFQAFMAGAFLNAVPGIILQIVLIPTVVMALRRNGLMLPSESQNGKRECEQKAEEEASQYKI